MAHEDDFKSVVCFALGAFDLEGIRAMAANKRTALATQSIEPSSDYHNWRIRSELWSHRSSKFANQRAKRERPRVPLVLCGHGVSLRIEGGALTIRNGFTHYPQKQ